MKKYYVITGIIIFFCIVPGCRQDGKTTAKKADDGSIRFEKTLISDSLKKTCILIERFLPEYFNPVNPGSHILGGTGAYSNHYTEFDAEKMKNMCFTVNWQASFDFPYMGMFVP